jgi:type II secretory pathway pseudopilin PulG
MKNSTKLIVLIVLVAVVAVALVFCAVVLPVVLQSHREAARREQTVNNLKQIGAALEQYKQRSTERPDTPIAHEPELAQPPQKQLDLMATVKPDSEFRIFRRRSEDNHWDDGSPFDRMTALKVIDALATATPWDANSHAAAYGMHAHAPGLTLDLSWCKDIQDKGQRDTQSVCLCYGNWLFWYGNSIYQVSQHSHEVLEGIFPENK